MGANNNPFDQPPAGQEAQSGVSNDPFDQSQTDPSSVTNDPNDRNDGWSFNQDPMAPRVYNLYGQAGEDYDPVAQSRDSILAATRSPDPIGAVLTRAAGEEANSFRLAMREALGTRIQNNSMFKPIGDPRPGVGIQPPVGNQPPPSSGPVGEGQGGGSQNPGSDPLDPGNAPTGGAGGDYGGGGGTGGLGWGSYGVPTPQEWASVEWSSEDLENIGQAIQAMPFTEQIKYIGQILFKGAFLGPMSALNTILKDNDVDLIGKAIDATPGARALVDILKEAVSKVPGLGGFFDDESGGVPNDPETLYIMREAMSSMNWTGSLADFAAAIQEVGMDASLVDLGAALSRRNIEYVSPYAPSTDGGLGEEAYGTLIDKWKQEQKDAEAPDGEGGGLLGRIAKWWREFWGDKDDETPDEPDEEEDK